MAVNLLILSGRPTADPKITDGGRAEFTLAVDKPVRKEGEPTANFVQCLAWNKQKEVVEKFVKKGTKLTVVGRLDNGNYKKADGSYGVYVHCIVNSIDLGSKSDAPTQEDAYMAIPNNLDELEIPFA